MSLTFFKYNKINLYYKENKKFIIQEKLIRLKSKNSFTLAIFWSIKILLS